MVSVIGSASTGTAIASLSGVAATNATLAWFGGGSLTAGGLWMLGGIVAAPLVYFSTKGTYEKVEKVKLQKMNLIAELDKMVKIYSEAEENLKNLERYHYSIKNEINKYIQVSQKEINKFKENTSFSFRLFGGEMTENQISAINNLDTLSTDIFNKLGVE